MFRGSQKIQLNLLY